MLYTITIIFLYMTVGHISSVQLLSQVQLLAIPWTTAHQAPLSITNSRTLLKLKSIESVMPSNHLILCGPLLLWHPLLLPSIFLMSWLFTSSGQSIWAWVSVSVLPIYCSYNWIYRLYFNKKHQCIVIIIRGQLLFFYNCKYNLRQLFNIYYLIFLLFWMC